MLINNELPLEECLDRVLSIHAVCGILVIGIPIYSQKLVVDFLKDGGLTT